jgi:hypothetical protein
MASPIIIHPCFQECQNFTLDQFWKDIFLLCACNKFPRGIRYDSSQRTLFVRTAGTGGRTKVEVVSLPENIEDIYLTSINIFKEKLGIFSSLNLQIKRDELKNIQSQRKVDLDCEWKKIKPRALKYQMIINYVSKLKETYNLNIKEAKLLLSRIQLGFHLKKICSDDVCYSNYEIQSINGLEYNNLKKEWLILNNPRIVNKTEKPVATQKFYQSVDKFAREYKSNRPYFSITLEKE